jgi:SpoVK/Ycf46/Vps4 family AAA+-type ATPase
LQFLEQEESDSIVVAATNYEAMLDDALFRRFDDVIRYQRPDSDQAIQLMRNRLGELLGKRIAWKKLESCAIGLSHAEIAKACDDAAKECILSETRSIDTAMLEAALRNRLRFDEGGHREKFQDASR